jgi:transcription antitermination factor NusB
MRKRTQARELALQLLYQVDLLRGKLTRDEEDRFLTDHAEGFEVRAYARALADGVAENRPAIDAAIDDVAKNWELGRMAVIDRNVLRMGIFELLYRPDIPPKVAINEAVDLAKKYSTKNSSAFVNGILDKIMEIAGKREPAPGGAPRTPAPPPPPPASEPAPGPERDEDEDDE